VEVDPPPLAKKPRGRPQKVPPTSDVSVLAPSEETATTMKCSQKAKAPADNEEPLQKKRRKLSNAKDTTEANTTLPAAGTHTKCKTVTRRNPLPVRQACNEHPCAREGVHPAARRTPSEMAVECDAVRLAAEEQILKGKEAVEFLAQMQLAQEQNDADMEMESEQRLSTFITRGHRRRNVPTESDGEEFEGIDSVGDSDSESSAEVVAEKVSLNLLIQYCDLSCGRARRREGKGGRAKRE